MKKRYISMCLIALMVFLSNMLVFADTNENIIESVNNQISSDETSTMSVTPDSNEEYLTEQMILPQGPGTDDHINGVFLQNYASYYFSQLKSYLGYNYKNTCSYIAVAMLLSYYDTYWDDNIISSQYEQVQDDFDINKSIESNSESPGIEPDEDRIKLEEKNLGIPINGELNDSQYNLLVSNNASTFFHFKLLEIGRTQLEISYKIYPWDIERLLKYYLYTEKGYNASKVTVERKGLDTQDNLKSYIINKVTQGIPVIVCAGYWDNDLKGHSFIIYDYDAVSDELYCHNGFDDGKTHVKFSTILYSTIGGVVSLDFKTEHSHSNNYVGKHNMEYCSCFAPTDIHPSHECRYYKKYNETYHTYACDCTPSADNLFEHNFVCGDPQSTCHCVYCSDCGYDLYVESHNYQYVTVNDEYHIQVCSDCGYELDPTVHNFESTSVNSGYHSDVCTDCSYTKTNSHIFQYASSSATQHTKVCVDCGYSAISTHTNWGYRSVNNQNHEKYCIDCGYVSGTMMHILKDASTAQYKQCSACKAWIDTSHSIFPTLPPQKTDPEEETE